MVVPLDLSDLNSLNDKVASILRIFGHIDILVNNGGVSVRADVVSTSVDVDIKVMAVNYFGSVAMTKGNVETSDIWKRVFAILSDDLIYEIQFVQIL